MVNRRIVELLDVYYSALILPLMRGCWFNSLLGRGRQSSRRWYRGRQRCRRWCRGRQSCRRWRRHRYYYTFAAPYGVILPLPYIADVINMAMYRAQREVHYRRCRLSSCRFELHRHRHWGLSFPFNWHGHLGSPCSPARSRMYACIGCRGHRLFSLIPSTMCLRFHGMIKFFKCLDPHLVVRLSSSRP